MCYCWFADTAWSVEAGGLSAAETCGVTRCTWLQHVLFYYCPQFSAEVLVCSRLGSVVTSVWLAYSCSWDLLMLSTLDRVCVTATAVLAHSSVWQRLHVVSTNPCCNRFSCLSRGLLTQALGDSRAHAAHEKPATGVYNCQQTQNSANSLFRRQCACWCKQ